MARDAREPRHIHTCGNRLECLLPRCGFKSETLRQTGYSMRFATSSVQLLGLGHNCDPWKTPYMPTFCPAFKVGTGTSTSLLLSRRNESLGHHGPIASSTFAQLIRKSLTWRLNRNINTCRSSSRIVEKVKAYPTGDPGVLDFLYFLFCQRAF
eukprot:3215213-Amphidinium_carterae.2